MSQKTYVLDTLYVDLIDRYAREQGVELKDVLGLALHEFFERRDYLPKEDRCATSRMPRICMAGR